MQGARDSGASKRVVNGIGVDAGIAAAQISDRRVSGERGIAANIRAAGRAGDCGPAADMVSATGKSCATAATATATATAEMTSANVTATAAKMTAATMTSTAMPATTMTSAATMTATAATRGIGGARKRDRKHNHRQPFDV
jgi:hypothetical protein